MHGTNAEPTHLGEGVVADDGGVVDVSEVARPRADSADVQAEVLLVGCRAERERMVLSAVQHRACDAHPLARLVLEVGRTLDVDGSDVCRHRDGRNITSTSTRPKAITRHRLSQITIGGGE